jgi:hypothetical protein
MRIQWVAEINRTNCLQVITTALCPSISTSTGIFNVVSLQNGRLPIILELRTTIKDVCVDTSQLIQIMLELTALLRVETQILIH